MARHKPRLFPGVFMLALDPQGKVAASSHRPRRYLGLDLRDYAFFQAHRQKIRKGLYVGPLTRLPASQSWVLPVSCAARAQDGSLKAVVTAFIAPEYLEGLFALTDLGPGSGLILAQKDGTVLANFPLKPKTAIASSASVSLLGNLFTRAEAGAIGEFAWLDGQKRLVAYGTLDSYPMVVALSLSPDYVKAPVYRAAGKWAIIFALVFCLTALAAYQLARKIPQRVPDSRRVSPAGFEESRLVKFLLNPHSGAIVYANKAACQFYGYTQEELTLLNVRDLTAIVPPEPMEQLRGLVAGERSVYQAGHRLASGEVLQVEIQAGPALIGGEKLFYVDVYGLPNANGVQEKSGRGKSFFNALPETTLTMMQRLDLSEVLQSIVAQAAEIMRAPHGWIAMVEEDEGALVTRHGVGFYRRRIGVSFRLGHGLSGRVWESGKPFQVEDYTLFPGRLKWMESEKIRAVMAVPLRVGPRVVGVLGLARGEGTSPFSQEEIETLNHFARLASIAMENARLYTAAQREVLQRRLAERSLRDSEQKYRNTFQDSPDAICIMEWKSGIILEINRGFSQVSGYTREQAVGKSLVYLGLFVDPLDQVRFIDTLKENGRIDRIETQFRRNDDSIIDCVVSASFIQYGGQDCVVSVVRDVTPLKKADEEKAKLQAQLQQAQKMEAVGILAGGVAHDFNNILQTILGYTQILQQSPQFMDKGRASLEQIVKAVEKATELIRQLLTFSRKVESKLKPLDLNGQIKEAAEFMGRILPKRIEIEFSLDPKLKAVMADATQMQQVLINLGTNAKDAMPHGGCLAIETQNVDNGKDILSEHPELKYGDYVHLRVADFGEGMDEKTLSHIFEPFFTTKALGQGTGLGLSTVYGIIKNHGGHIWCQSQPGKGTVFDICLPACRETLALKEDRSEVLSPKGGKETFLLVEFDQPIRRMTKQMLEKMGYIVLTASIGEEALQILNEKAAEIALVVLDLDLPRMVGNGFYEQLLDKKSQIKVLLISDQERASQKEKYLGWEKKPKIIKPFSRNQLLQTVRDVLES